MNEIPTPPQTEAERRKLERCPRCEKRSLKVTHYRGGTMHDCQSYAYLACWRETEIPIVSRIQT